MLLGDTAWLSDDDVDLVEDLSGWIPVTLTFSDSVFTLHLFAEPEATSEHCVGYVRVEGLMTRDASCASSTGRPARPPPIPPTSSWPSTRRPPGSWPRPPPHPTEAARD